jgi:cytochrome c-type biogenesis protein
MIAALPASLIAAFPLAFAAGLVSFVSPCVLPLLPGYLAFLGGSAGRAASRGGRGRTVVGSVAFVLGFTAVFVSFGALFGEFGATLKSHQRPLEIAFGVVTIVLGCFFAGWWPSSWLQRERRVHFLPRASVMGAALLGLFFAVGWTPCIGPTLAAIDGLAASSSGATALRGSILAFVYCLGLGLPFVVAALATEWMAGATGWLRRHAKVIGVVGGVMLILIGVTELTGWWQTFVLWIQTNLPFTPSV